MASLLRLRVLLPLAVLCLGGCLSDQTFPQDVKEDHPQGDDPASSLTILAEHHQKSCYYEDDQRFPPIIERDVWEKKRNSLYTHWPVDYIVVGNGGKDCKTHPECMASLSHEVQKTGEDVCRTRENFYVGGDGEVYEGRGWNVSPYWHLNGMRRKAVAVKFFGDYESEPPRERALRAFWRMATTGVWEAKLSPDFKVVSMGQVYNDSTLVGKALEKVLQDSGVGVNEVSLVATWEYMPDKSLPLVSRQEWGAKKPTKPMTKMGHSLKYVMINEGGERCFTPEDCKSRIKAEQEEQLSIYGDLVDNFYIGDDGYVYEGRGYSYKPLWDTEIEMEDNKYFKDESLTVRFFGKFQSEHPSEEAIGALKLLINAGNSLNKIPDRYKLYSLRGIYNDSRFLGDKFFEIAREWTPWANELDDRFAKELGDGTGFIGMVNRMGWEAKDPVKEYEKIKHPVDYVVINENSESDRCLSSKDCISDMKEMQEKDLDRYGDVVDNFYISDSGNIYEGRGWDTEPLFQQKYFNKSLITVNFIGNHKEEGASLTALAAFDNLIRVGVNLEKIAPNYHFYSSRNVYDADVLLGDELKKYFEKSEHWSKKLDAMSENDRFDAGLLPITPRSEWSETSVETAHHPYAEPIRYVVVGSIGDRCFTHEDCITVMKELSDSGQKGLLNNFYIGNDGNAYEGRGWMFAPSMYSKDFKFEFYYVTFLGKYEEEHKPSKLSILAFDRLMENGVRTDKLSPDYKIIFDHQIFTTELTSTDNLYNAVRAWERWTPEVSIVPEIEATPSGQHVIVHRADWDAHKHVASVPILEHPLGYVLVHNVGEHCNDLASCTQSVQNIEQNTPEKYKDVTENFYVGDDGHVYEGRGWYHSSLWATKGIESKFISVGFLGSSEDDPPSSKALLAFHILQQTGVVMGALKHDFQTISMGDIMKEEAVVTDKLIVALNGTEHWSSEFDLKYDLARLKSLYSPFVLSDEWNVAKLSIRAASELKKPLKFIAIRDGGEPCSTNETCVMRIRKEHEGRHESSDNGIAENFYVGNDGNVYEGIGWDWDMTWGFNGWDKTVSVQFFGNYGNSLPSDKAIEAFKSVIIKDGIAAGKLSAQYKIIPIPEGDERTLGSKLREEILTWENAIPEIENS